VGKIALAPAGYADFFGRFFGVVKHGHAPSAPGRFYAAHQAGGARAHNHHIEFYRCHFFS
jgi:hypothetical protein